MTSLNRVLIVYLSYIKNNKKTVYKNIAKGNDTDTG